MDDIARDDFTSFPRENAAVIESRQKENEKIRKKQRQEAREENAQAKRMGAKPAKSGDELDEERAVLTRRLEQYYDKLGERITVKRPRSWPKDVEALRELCARIRVDLDSSGSIELCADMYKSGVAVIEQVTPLVTSRVLLSGPAASLTATLDKNPQLWRDLVTQVAIENSEYFMASALKRLVFVTGKIAMSVDAANKSALAESARAEPSAELAQAAEEL